MEELRKRYVNGVDAIDRGVLAYDYIDSWYRTYKEPHIAASSRRGYESILAAHIKPEFDNVRMRAVTALQIQAFLNSKKGLGDTTITLITALLKNPFAHAAASGVIDRDPSQTLIKPRCDSTSRRALTDKETAAILRVSAKHKYGILLALLFYTGARRGEVLGLQWGDIDFKTKWIHIERDIDFVTNTVGAVKTSSSVRDVPLPEPLQRVLEPLRGVGCT